MDIDAIYSTRPALEFAENDRAGAAFSPCRQYRYALWRRRSDCKVARMAAFVGLNPSTADETANDPTVTRCINFAKSWGYEGMFMLNAFAFRATDPRVMKAHPSPVGPENDRFILNITRRAGVTVLAWGVHCVHLQRAEFLLNQFREQQIPVHCLGLTKDAHPKHPLYLKQDLHPIPMN